MPIQVKRHLATLTAVGACLLICTSPACAEPAASAESAESAENTTRQITVTASRIAQPVRDVPTHVTIIDRHALDRTAARTIDDQLRNIPGFSLFRRSSSLVAHPTSQGVSLRGLGPSGASRTLVLVDGVPANDPFGGWIHWSLIPPLSVQRIEVVRGGGSSVWGNSALAGVVSIHTISPDRDRVQWSVAGGERDSGDLQGLLTVRRGKLGVALNTRYFQTGGYPTLRADQRGSIDTDADSEYGTTSLRLDYDVTRATTLTLDGRYFEERRGNGTRLTDNRTHIATVHAGLLRSGLDGATLRADLFAVFQKFESRFSSQADDRGSENPALDQFDVPSTAVGGSLVWSQSVGSHHLLSAGLDALWTEGETNENYRYRQGAFHSTRRAGGEQGLVGLYLQDIVALTDRLVLTAAGRVDHWHSTEGMRRERSLDDDSLLRDQDFPSRDTTLFSPRVGLSYDANAFTTLLAAYYRGFRAPTINELYRPFRVRNDITEANANLAVERLQGAETGLHILARGVELDLTAFWNQLDDAVANLTVGSGPGSVEPCGFVPQGGICRQRDNLDRLRVVGLEADLTVPCGRFGSVGAAYLLSDARIMDAHQDRSIQGHRVAQVPQHTVVLQALYDDPQRGSAAAVLRYVSDQFEDDRNTLSLGGYTTVDLFLARPLKNEMEAFVAVENLFDRQFDVGRSADGNVTVGMPRMMYAGLRFGR